MVEYSINRTFRKMRIVSGFLPLNALLMGFSAFFHQPLFWAFCFEGGNS